MPHSDYLARRVPTTLWHSFLTAASTSENVLSINTMLTVVHDIWVAHLARWKAEMARCCCSFALFHTSTSIHQAIHLSHSSLLLFHTSVSLSPVGPCLEVPSVSAVQGGVTERMRPRGETSNVGCWPWFYTPSTPPTPSTPSHLYLSLLAPPSVCAWFGAGCRGRERKGPPPMTNDNLRINTRVREGRRKRAESLFHHPSASVGLLINLWSLPLTLFWCLSLIFCLFTQVCKDIKRFVLLQ